MRRSLIILASLCGLALLAIIQLHPTEALRLEGELASLTPDAALDRLDHAAGRIAFNENLALVHARLALDAGDVARARHALAALGAAADGNAPMQDHLAEVERLAGNLPAATAHLARAHHLDPTEARRLKLGAWHRVQKDAAAELSVLQSVPPEKLTEWELDRLAQLYQSTGQPEQLESLITAAAEWTDPSANRHKARLIDLLAEDGRLDQAQANAARWFDRARPDQGALLATIPVLIDRGATAPAYGLARLSMDKAPETSHLLLPLFARSGHRDLALDLQTRWLAGDRFLSDPEWQTLVTLASLSGDLRGLRRALAIASPGQVNPRTLEAVLLVLLRFQGPQALAPFARHVTPDLLARAPLIGAAWMAQSNHPEAAATYLAAASARPMIDWDRDIWLATAARLRGTPGHRVLLGQATADSGLRAALARDFIAPVDPALAP